MDISSVDTPPVSLPVRQSTGGSQDAVPAANPVSSNTPAPATSTTGNTAAAPTPEALAKAISNVNDSFAQMGQNLYASYQKDKITGIEVVQFKDKNTHEVIRQIPSKEMLAIAQSLSLPSGIPGQLIYDKA